MIQSLVKQVRNEIDNDLDLFINKIETNQYQIEDVEHQLLTGELSKEEAIKRYLECKALNQQLRENYKLLISANNPSKNNLPLPNGAEITYKFGARAYITDQHPGFVWRNGSWYTIKDNTKFHPMTPDRMNLIDDGQFFVSSSKNNSDVDPIIMLSDIFEPFIYNGNRVFCAIASVSVHKIATFNHIIVKNPDLVKRIESMFNYTKKVDDVFIYNPLTQVAVRTKISNVLDVGAYPEDHRGCSLIQGYILNAVYGDYLKYIKYILPDFKDNFKSVNGKDLF